MIYAGPGETFEATVGGAATGLTGTIGVRVLNTPGNNIAVARTTAGISEAPPGSGIYAVTLTAPATAGTYSVIWDNGAGLFSDPEDLVVTSSIYAPPGGPFILSLGEFKALAGITDTAQDDKINAFLPLVHNAVREYTERKFGDADTTETRVFKWDGRGSVEIDDVKDITAVTVGGVAYVADLQYVTGPDRETRQYWLELPPARKQDSEMGFTYNLDVYGPLAHRFFPVNVGVTGTFGYPTAEVPGSVKLAAFLGLSQAVESPSEGNLSAESIDTYARSWDTGAAQQTQNLPTEFLPARALTLLDPFVRRTGGA